MKPQTLSIALLLLAATLAGCASGDSTTVTLTVDDGDAPETATMTVDLSSRPGQELYDKSGASHPDFYSALDQLVQWSDETGTSVELTYSSSFGDFFVAQIGGKPTNGAGAYWSLSVNGTPSQVGLGQVALHGGERVTWTLTPIDATPTAAPLKLTTPARLTTMAASIQVNGTTSGPAKLTFLPAGLNVATRQVDGAWSAVVPLLPGRLTLRVVASNDIETVAQNVTLVRLVPLTVQVDYKMAPGHANRDDTVWFDLGEFASAPQYAGKDLSHPGKATVHDLMVAWTNQTKIQVTYAYSNGLGYSVSQIDGIGSPLAGAPVQPWCYNLNGESADFGMSSQVVAPDDVVEWVLGCV